jgi:hypothetical protein
VVNLKADTLDITQSPASSNTKRIVYWNGEYYYSNGTNWLVLGGGGGSGTVTDVTATEPLSSSGGDTPDISISQSNNTTDGYLSSTDWNTFNGKQNALGFTAENVANKDTDGTLAANSDTNYASQKATKTYVDTQVATKSDKNITLDRKTASYTLVASDNGKMIEMNVGSANTLTINASLFSAGNQILISQYGAGQTTITAGAGVTLRSSGGKLKTSAQYSLVTIIAISSTEFYIAGDLTA